MIMKPDIRNLSFQEFVQYMEKIEEKSFRAKQIFDWIYHKGVWSFDDMRNLPKATVEKLKNDFTLKPNVIVQKLVAEDATTKFLFD